MMRDSFPVPNGLVILAARAVRLAAHGIVSAGLSALILACPAMANEKAACSEGIDMIKTEIDKSPPEAVLSKLKKALRVAEREMGEGEFDECVDAVGDAKRALK